MKLAIAIIQDEFIMKVVKALTAEKIRTTKLASTGGFLKHGSTTLLIGAEDDQVEEVVDLIRDLCNTRKINDGDREITVGGANIFIVDVNQYVRI